jgi:hypothetical protein
MLAVTEWLDASPSAWRSLWATLHHLAGDQLPVTLPPLPPDRPWDALWPETYQMRPIRSMLFRPGAPDHFWPTVACSPGEGELHVSVVDPFRLWPAKLRIRWTDGRIVSWEPTDRTELHTDVGTLGLLALGFMRVDEAVRLRRLDGETEALSRLAKAFAPASLYRYPADFRAIKRSRIDRP